MKAIYDKSIANIMLNGKRMKSFLLWSGAIHGCPLLPRLLEVLSGALGKKKKNNRHPNQKGRSKIVSLLDDMILCVEDHRLHQKVLCQQIMYNLYS